MGKAAGRSRGGTVKRGPAPGPKASPASYERKLAEAFPGSRQLRDTESGVRIEFLVAGEYPGDGNPKPVAFPDPAEIDTIEKDGVRYAGLPGLIELKLASGLTAPGRLKDLADVQELVKALGLPKGFADRLNPYVREKYLDLWT